MELDTRIPALCARAHDDVSKPYPTFALAMSMFDNPSWDVMSPQRPLRYWRLVEPNRLMSQALISAPLHTDERLVAFVKGLNYLDERIVKDHRSFFHYNKRPAASCVATKYRGRGCKKYSGNEHSAIHHNAACWYR